MAGFILLMLGLFLGVHKADHKVIGVLIMFAGLVSMLKFLTSLQVSTKMSELKLCQGPDCHTYNTQDRLKDLKEIRLIKLEVLRSRFYLLPMETFAIKDVWYDWIRKYGTQAINHFGRLQHKYKHLTEQNAWLKDYDWRGNVDESHRYFLVNSIDKGAQTIDRGAIS